VNVDYLAKNLNGNNNFDIWYIWLNGGSTKRNKTKTHIKNVSPSELILHEDVVVWYM